MLDAMRTVAQALGDDAEELVAQRLSQAGWRIVGRKVRVGRAEIDILAVDPGDPCLVAVEVRWRRRRDFGLPEETVPRAKLLRLRAALASLRLDAGDSLAVPPLPARVDVVAVEPGGRVRHHQGVG